jgi:hypothetical protein
MKGSAPISGQGFLIGRFPPSALSHRGRRLGIGPVQRVSAAILSTLACPSRRVSPRAANSRSKFDRTTPIEKISRRPASGFYRRRPLIPASVKEFSTLRAF